MKFEVVVTRNFARELKQLVKRYPSIKGDISILINSLEENPTQGKSLGKSCYKIRLSVSSKSQGKSGGARIITYVYVSGRTVNLLSIYDKSSRETITDKELKEWLRNIQP